jgi:CheY-like chemotaxis protein
MSRERVLIVEDDPEVREGMQVRLRANDYQTGVAGDTASAMAEARAQTSADSSRPLGLPAATGVERRDMKSEEACSGVSLRKRGDVGAATLLRLPAGLRVTALRP